MDLKHKSDAEILSVVNPIMSVVEPELHNF